MTAKIKKTSITDTMARMSSRMDDILDNASRQKIADPDDLPIELQAFMAIDPLLADLHKQMVDARAQHSKLAKLRGVADPMTDVANDMMDSARTAFETRLLELRRQQDTKSRVLAMIRKAQDEAEAERVAEAQAKAQQFWTEFAINKNRRVKSPVVDNTWLILAGMLMMRGILDRAAESGLSSDFGHASSRGRGDDLKSRFAAC